MQISDVRYPGYYVRCSMDPCAVPASAQCRVPPMGASFGPVADPGSEQPKIAGMVGHQAAWKTHAAATRLALPMPVGVLSVIPCWNGQAAPALLLCIAMHFLVVRSFLSDMSHARPSGTESLFSTSSTSWSLEALCGRVRSPSLPSPLYPHHLASTPKHTCTRALTHIFNPVCVQNHCV